MTAACRFGPVVMPPLERLSVRVGYRLLWVDGDAADSHLLGSKIARLAADEQRSWQELERAAELAPEDPVVWFERFQTARGSADEQIRSQVAAELKG